MCVFVGACGGAEVGCGELMERTKNGRKGKGKGGGAGVSVCVLNTPSVCKWKPEESRRVLEFACKTSTALAKQLCCS